MMMMTNKFFGNNLLMAKVRGTSNFGQSNHGEIHSPIMNRPLAVSKSLLATSFLEYMKYFLELELLMMR